MIHKILTLGCKCVFLFCSTLSCFVTALMLFPLSCQGQEIPAGVYSYRQTEGEVVTPFYWKVEKQGPQRLVSVYEKEKSFINLCAVDGATLEWQLKDPDKNLDITARRQGNMLNISGLRDGENYAETVDIDDRPWYQPLSYSLRKFLGSKETSMTFWTIRADTVEVTSLEVEKMGEEVVVVNQKKILAEKVELRPEGFYSNFWHGTYWYRKSDKIFVMYRSVQGLTGTAETVVELMSEPGPQEKS